MLAYKCINVKSIPTSIVYLNIYLILLKRNHNNLVK